MDKKEPCGADFLAGLEGGRANSKVNKFKVAYLMLAGIGLIIVGGFLFLNNVVVTSGFWSLFGHSAFGMTLVPVFIGILMLFVNRKSMWGWILAGGGSAIIIAGVIADLHVFFKPTSLFNTILMIGMIAAGLGLVIRSIKIRNGEDS